MATYILLLRYTQQGIGNVKESANRLDAAKKFFKSMGAEIKQTFLVTGQYDFVVVVEAPDDETITKVVLTTGSMGNVRTETLRAFPEDEYRKIIASLP